jgi:hypothetical protein
MLVDSHTPRATKSLMTAHPAGWNKDWNRSWSEMPMSITPVVIAVPSGPCTASVFIDTNLSEFVNFVSSELRNPYAKVVQKGW